MPGDPATTCSIVNVMAVSLDGKIASYPGEPDRDRRALGFTNDDDHQHLLQLLRTTDAVIIGSQSLLGSGGALVQRNDRGEYPIWAVLTTTGLPESSPFYHQSELPRWLVSPVARSLPAHHAGVRTIDSSRRGSPQTVVSALQAAGARRVLLFGGSEINRLFYAEGLVDQLILTLCPIILGGNRSIPLVSPPLVAPVKLELVASQPKGNLVFLTYNVLKS